MSSVDSMTYTNLEQRMAHAYLDMLPPFVPWADGDVPVQSQEQFYRFMRNVYHTLFDKPELLFTRIYEDDAYPNRYNRASYGDATLYNHMKRDLKEIDGLLAWLFSLGQTGVIDDDRLIAPGAAAAKKKHRKVLPYLGLTLEGEVLSCRDYPGLFDAWTWMASKDNATVVTFSRCMFDPAYSYTESVYAPLFGDEEAFGKLVRSLDEHGYARYDLARGPYTLDYVKQDVAGDFPLGSPLHGDPRHYGLSADYRPDVAVPPFLVLRILDLKGMLEKFNAMPEDTQSFVVQHAHHCDECGYCTQTDKTGKRQPLAVPISHLGDHRLCPLYPGFTFTFTEIDDDLATDLIAFLGFMDDHIRSRGPVKPLQPRR